MHKKHNPDAIAPPFSPYSHGVEVGTNARWLYVSGQVGVRPDGTTPEDLVEQNEQTWENIRAILTSAAMSVSDIVRINAYVTTEEGIAAFRDVRNKVVGEARPASTLVRVAGLASPQWGVEIEVVAAKV